MNPFLLIVIALILSAFFSGMEIAFVSSNKLRIELERKQGKFSAKVVAFLTRNPQQYIATMLVGNNVALVVYGIFMAFLLEPAIENHITTHASGILLIQTIVSTIIILFTAEFTPKTLFRINPNLLLGVFSVPVLFFYIILFPVSRFTIWISGGFIRLLFKHNINKQSKQLVFGKPDLDHLLTEAKDEKQEDKEDEPELKIFQNALDFSNVKVRDCMIPRTDMLALDVKTSIEDLCQQFVDSGYSKILIYNDKIDNIIGYITHKELLKRPQNIQSKLKKISFVPETLPASKLLGKLIKEHKSIAVVVDEYGGVSGMLTVEDIIEEITGEIEDEHDNSELTEKRISKNKYLFSGRLEIDYLNEEYNLNLPEHEEYDTLAGLVIYNTDRIPEPEEIVEINESFRLVIKKVTETRIELLTLETILE
jgi:CBS domain containing-hemolysin-like protein